MSTLIVDFTGFVNMVVRMVVNHISQRKLPNSKNEFVIAVAQPNDFTYFDDEIAHT